VTVTRAAVALATLLTGVTPAVRAQGVVVAPHAVYIDHRTRSGSLTLYNPGAEPVEVDVAFSYGYPVTDSAGRFTLYEPPASDSGVPTADHWLEAFPRRMELQPLQRQTVRLLARPPAGLPDGEYWARAVIAARGGTVPVTGADTSRIQIGLSLEVHTNLPLIYRKGVLHTGVLASNLRVSLRADSLIVRAHLDRQGQAAYVGTAQGELVDSAGTVAARFSQPVAVYHEADPAFAFPIAGLPGGPYRVRLLLTSERNDIAPELLLRAPAVRDSVSLRLP
jgi:hypothetical protein